MAAKFGVLLRVHVLNGFIFNFVKDYLGLNNVYFVYGELGRMNCQYVRYFSIIKYWVKYYMQTTISTLKKCAAC